MQSRVATRGDGMRIECARGDLNSSRARCIAVHFRSSEAVSGASHCLSDPGNNIHGHLDTGRRYQIWYQNRP
jgi:hypothetical protein